MPPYDTIVWGEAQAASGLVGTAALSGQNHTASGDKITLLSTPDPPILLGLGAISDTKPAASALVPDEMKAQLPIHGPAGIKFWQDGWDKSLREAPIVLFKGDKLTGQMSNTNVNEGSLVGADIAYKTPPPPWTLKAIQSRYKQIFQDKFTITSTAAVTFGSGPVSLDAAASNFSKWSNPNGKFEILGSIGHVGAATFGGIAHIRNVGGSEWQQKQPGIIINPLSAVDFNAGGFVPVLEPIPFDGDALPEISITATSSGAMIFALKIGELA